MIPLDDIVFYDKKDATAHAAAKADLPQKGYKLCSEKTVMGAAGPLHSAVWVNISKVVNPASLCPGVKAFESFVIDADQPLGKAVALLEGSYLDHVVIKRRQGTKFIWRVFDIEDFFTKHLPQDWKLKLHESLINVMTDLDSYPDSPELHLDELRLLHLQGYVDPAKPPVVAIADDVTAYVLKTLTAAQTALLAELKLPDASPPFSSDLFPVTEPSDEHPVQKTEIKITVRMSAEPTSHTAGRVELPPGPAKLQLDLHVHLLFGENSHWDTLKTTRGGTTLKPAVFTVTVPGVRPRPDGIVPDHQVHDIRANFYLNGRWCGEAVRSIGVRSSGEKPHVEARTDPAKLARNVVNLEPGATPADLLVRIQEDPVVPNSYIWTMRSPHVNFPWSKPEDCRMKLKQSAQDFIRDLFEPFASIELDDKAIMHIQGRGEEIYKATPQAFKDAYWCLRNHKPPWGGDSLRTIQFITDEPYIPWELMRVSHPDPGSGVAAEFLGVLHQTGRWLARSSGRLTQNIEVRDMAVFATDYEKVPHILPKLPWAEQEGVLLKGTYGASRIEVRLDSFIDFLRNGSAQIVHLACHGRMYADAPNSSRLIMEDTPVGEDLPARFCTPHLVAHDAVRQGIGRHHPLVFLNACQLAAAGRSLTLVAGWPEAFLDAGASAFVGPLWTVMDEHAKHVSEEFYGKALASGRPATLGEILSGIRSRWKSTGRLTYLAYVLYGDPKARVKFTRSAAPPTKGNP